MISLNILLLFLIILINFVIGLLVFFTQPKGKANRSFALLIFFLIIWLLTHYFQSEPFLKNYAVALLRADFVFGIMLCASFYLFSLIFPKLEAPFSGKRRSIFVPAIFLAILSFSNFILKNPYFRDGTIDAEPGSLFWIYFLFALFYIGGGIRNLYIKYKKSTGIEKTQILYVLSGLGISATVLFTINLIIATFILIPLEVSRMGIYSLLIFCIFTALAITRYHLFEIIVILTESLVAVIGLVMIIQIFIAPNLLWRLINGIVFALFIIVGYYLIRATIREIRRREEMEKLSLQLKAANVELDKLSKAKSEFISIASHQLRTPLSVIKGYISMILEGTYGALPKTAKRPLENVYKSNERLINLVNNLLNISRIESGRMEFEPEETSIEEIIDGVVFDLRINAEKKKLYLKWKKPEPSLPKILLDKDKMRQVILNLVDNAIKYTQQGGITIKLLIANCKLLIAIADTGEGMTKEDLGKIFESFSRGTVGTRAYTEGAGLGLYIARRFVEMHGGKIWAESEGKNKGSTFYIELPIK